MQTMDAALADARPRGQDHPARSPSSAPPPRTSCGACSAAAAAARHGRLDAMATYVFKAIDLAGRAGARRGRGREQAGRRRPAQAARADRPRHRGQARVQGDRDRRSSSRIKPRDLTVMTRQLATMVNSGMTILRALYVLEAQTENKQLSDDDRRRPQGRRGRPAAVRRAGAPPQGLQPALRRDDPRRRDRRRARRVADPRRRPARDGRLAAPPGQGRDGLPAGGHGLRVHRAASRWSPSWCRSSSASSSSSAATCRRSRSSPSALSNAITGYWWALHHRRRSRAVCGFRKWKTRRRGPRASGTRFKLRIPMKIGDIVQKIALARWSRTLSRARQRRRAAPAGAGDHRQDRRQPVRREGHGRRDRVASSQGGTIADAAQERPGVPGHGQSTWSASARRPAPWTRC